MANDLSESYLNVPDSDEDDGLVNFSQYYFKEWSEVEALYKLTMYNESVEEKAELPAETSEDESEMEKDSSDDEDDEDCIDILGKALDNMVRILSKPRSLYENPMLGLRCYASLDVFIGTDSGETPDDGWKSDEMDDESFELSSDDDSSSLSN